MGAIGNMKALLYASPPDAQLQVTPRRRLRITSTDSAVASVSTSFTHSFPALTDILGPNDGLQIDWVLVSLAAAAPGLNLTLLAVTLNTVLQSVAAGFPLGQGVTTLNGLQGAATLGLISPIFLNPSPSLITSNDLATVTLAKAGPLAPADQPITPVAAYAVTNTTAGAINITFIANLFYRLVRGLQEN